MVTCHGKLLRVQVTFARTIIARASPGRKTLKIVPMRHCNFSIYNFRRNFSVHVWIPFVHNAPDIFILMTVIKISNFSCNKTKPASCISTWVRQEKCGRVLTWTRWCCWVTCWVCSSWLRCRCFSCHGCSQTTVKK